MRQRQMLLKHGVSLCAAAAFAAFALLPSAEARYGDPNDPKWKRPEKPTITSPTAGSRLPSASKIHVHGTGLVTPRVGGWRYYMIAGKITPIYTPAKGGARVRATNSAKGFTAGTYDKSGKWENKTVTLPTLQKGWKDVVFEISVTQRAREERDDHPTLEVNPLSSAPTVIEVQPFQQPESDTGNSSEGVSDPKGGSSGDKVTPPSSGVTQLQIITPVHNSEVEPTIRISGLAQAGTNVRVTVKRRMDSIAPDRGRRRIKRKVSITVGTFTSRVDENNKWEIDQGVHLKPVQTEKTAKMDYTKIDFVITAVQIDSKGNESKPVERIVKPYHADFW